MDEFEWAEHNLGVTTAQELREGAVAVHAGEHIPDEERIVDLSDGSMHIYHRGQTRPHGGLYADEAGLRRYCAHVGLPFAEVDGQIVIQPYRQR